MAGENEENITTNEESTRLDKLRNRVKQYIDKHQYESAVFWADKVVTISKDALADVYMHAQALYLTKQYHRAAHVLKSRDLHKCEAACKFLVAKCHVEVKEFQEALDILEGADEVWKTPNRGVVTSNKTIYTSQLQVTNVGSSINLLKGKIFESLENRLQATEHYREALKQDVYCYEAFELLVKHQMLSCEEERQLIDSLPFNSQCSDEEAAIVRAVYMSILKKYDKPSPLVTPDALVPLKQNLDIITSQAERYYYHSDFRSTYAITSRVLETDPFHSTCLPLHIATLVELQKSNELFYLGHRLVDLYPCKAVAWFAVGCYYFLVGKQDAARRFLSKATSLDHLYGPAWLAFGHSFAIQGEHDQAMAAYFTASQLMKGCHLPVLYVGLEQGLTNNPQLAEKFFSQALSIAPSDPFVLHEMGVVAYQSGNWSKAEKYFLEAIVELQGLGEGALSEKWEPILNNLGHVCRKLGKYDEALGYHQRALVLSPQNPSTFASIGFVYCLQANFNTAIDYFHKALGLRRDDTFSVTMLTHVIEQSICDMPACEGAEDLCDLPNLSLKDTSTLSQGSLKLERTPQNDSSLDIEIEMDL
ncbi:cell division cycle protein 16 homolog [Anneissia japonica]|uniref:cell division cycle protein 16 homolog n=1 Tax=Anneissia japonica TaxID=1529436 RepID=UPI0014257A35|nr:cell division cycle protein 16 homolog [Anneissia japonica]